MAIQRGQNVIEPKLVDNAKSTYHPRRGWLVAVFRRYDWLVDGSLLRSDLLKVAMFLDAFKSVSIWKPLVFTFEDLALAIIFVS